MRLRVPRHEAEAILDRHIEEGTSISAEAASVTDLDSYREWQGRFRRWRDVTSRALQRVFSTNEASGAFRSAASPGVVVVTGNVDDEFRDDQSALANGVNKLQSLKEQLEYIDEPTVIAEDEAPSPNAARGARARVPTANAKVFVVHGRDDALKTRVQLLLERTGEHEITVLHEQPDRGRTIIEKFEDHASDADYAVVLLSGDDLGRLNPKFAEKGEEEPAEAPRARQNVVLELGYFLGQLGRARVTVLYEPGVEIPSDYTGVAYTELDPGGTWEAKLLLELRSADLSFDLNKLS